MDAIRYIREHSSELDPLPSGEKPVIRSIPGIRGVVFDIYGTIMVSAAGDISLAGQSPTEAARTVLDYFGLGGDAAAFHQSYHDAVKRFSEVRRKEGVEFPEIEIREVWAEVLANNGGDPGTAEIAGVVYECAANPVWPMPGLEPCLAGLGERGMALGIVSNAQFYTRELFPALCGKSLEELGFDPALMVFSYQLREGKPSRELYRSLATALAGQGIQPAEILYVGNDRLKDVWPAQLEGFRTALFAGDQRSLRWRREDGRLEGVEPDVVLTHLDQIQEVIGV